MVQITHPEFEALMDPVIKWMNDNCHPHTTIIVTPTSAELVEGTIAFTTLKHVKD